MIQFEFDDTKSNSNFDKHGIDFIRAQKLWEDDSHLEVRVRQDGEPRYVVIGLLEGKHWTAVITYRSDNIRIISVRCARKSEVALYENRRI